MSPERRSRQYRRVAQACENCRRKKIRCPGQKPNCSACARLNQECCYKEEGTSVTNKSERRMSDRLSRVEQRLEQIFDSMHPSQQAQSATSAQEATPATTAGIQHAEAANSPAAWSTQPSPGTTPKQSIDIALQVYFEHIHRQPLWLLEPDSVSPVETSEELMCIILALCITCCPARVTESNLKPASFYASRASSLAMLQIAGQQVNLQSLQCLCLLAFYNVINGDLHLANLHVALTRSVLYYFLQTTGDSTPNATADRSRLFWSLTYLEAFYGPPILVPSIPGHISTPQLSVMEPGFTAAGCLPLPEVFRQGETPTAYESLDDIWSQSMRFSSLWRETRLYVSRCIEGLNETPWQPSSTYNLLCSRINDLEEVWPRRLSYNVAKFQDRPPAEVQRNSLTWIPWLRVQVMYHMVLCVINHPFLYLLGGAKTISPTNTFWRGSFEKALRHCTWVSRLLRMAGEKGLTLTDPIFAQAAGVAGSLHLYWMRAKDDNLRNSASKNLRFCKSFITSMKATWPTCRSIEKGLDTLIDALNHSESASGSTKLTITGPMCLMWTLLDIAAPQFPGYTGERSYLKASWDVSIDPRGRPSMEYAESDSDPRDMRESTAHYDSPPAWASSRLADPDVRPMNGGGINQDFAQRLEGDWTGDRGLQQDDIILMDPTWGPMEQLLLLGDGAPTSLEWWELGNL